jgi:hypothetical protein
MHRRPDASRHCVTPYDVKLLLRLRRQLHPGNMPIANCRIGALLGRGGHHAIPKRRSLPHEI